MALTALYGKPSGCCVLPQLLLMSVACGGPTSAVPPVGTRHHLAGGAQIERQGYNVALVALGDGRTWMLSGGAEEHTYTMNAEGQ